MAWVITFVVTIATTAESDGILKIMVLVEGQMPTMDSTVRLLCETQGSAKLSRGLGRYLSRFSRPTSLMGTVQDYLFSVG